MIILTTSANQSFPTIPIKQFDIDGNDIFMVFINETTKETHSLEASNRIPLNDILYIGNENMDFLKEGIFYTLNVYFANTQELIYKDIVFVTNQPKATYSINNGQYVTPNIDNNNYITI